MHAVGVSSGPAAQMIACRVADIAEGTNLPSAQLDGLQAYLTIDGVLGGRGRM